MKQEHEKIMNNIGEVKDDISNNFFVLNNNYKSIGDKMEKNERNILQGNNETF
jgi:hypothetical protein